MAKKQSKNSRAARRGELDNQIETEVSNTPEVDGKTRALQELAAKQTREETDESLKPKSSVKTKSRAKSKRDKLKKMKGEAFNDMLAEKVKTSTERHKAVREYRKGESDEKDA